MTFRRFMISVGLAPACLTSSLLAQGPERTLGAPAARLAEPFSEIAAVRELRDGRVLVLDGKEQRIVVADLVRGSVIPVGAKGRGPGEFLHALRFIALPGDTTWVVDAQGGRVLVIGPDATPIGVVTTFPSPAADSGISTNALRAADGLGRLYFVKTKAPISEGNLAPPDSTRIMRYDRARGVVTAVGLAALPDTKINVKRSGKQITAVDVVRTPFSVGDEWDVSASGVVVIARRAPYRVEVLAPGRPSVRGPAIAANTRKVTAADKTAYLASVPNGASMKPEDLPWPEVMPVFLARALVVTDREAWVRRSAAADAKVATHDVFDPQGRRIAGMSLPTEVRILLVTARGVYVSRTDEDGLQYVERHALPR
jgi:hypothetical protein